jgi:hypothetical protein
MPKGQRSRSRFRWPNAQKQPTRNIVAKKRAGQRDVDFDYLSGDERGEDRALCDALIAAEGQLKS